MSLAVLRRGVRQRWQSLAVSPLSVRSTTGNSRRGLVFNAAASGDHDTESAVSDCLERVLGPQASTQCDFALIFYEGHDGTRVQKALDEYASRQTNLPLVFGCSLNDGWKKHEREQELKRRREESIYNKKRAEQGKGGDRGGGAASGQSSATASPSQAASKSYGFRGNDSAEIRRPIEEISAAESSEDSSEGSSEEESGTEPRGLKEDQATDDDDSSDDDDDDYDDDDDDPLAVGELNPKAKNILREVSVVVEGLDRHSRNRSTRNGSPPVSRRKARKMRRKKELMRRNFFEAQGASSRIVTVLGLGFEGRAEAIPAVANHASFPDLDGGRKVEKVFTLPAGQKSHFLLLGRKNSSQGLERSLERISRLLPGGTRLAGVSSGDKGSLVASFPFGESPSVGICVAGDVTVKEQAELASKTLGAFGVSEVVVAGGACEELFVPRSPFLLPRPPPPPQQQLQPSSSQSAAPTTPAAQVDVVAEGDQARNDQVGDIVGAGAKTVEDGGIGVDKAERSGRPASVEDTGAGQTEQDTRRWLAPSQMSVFKVDDFVYPGMRRRYNIFEPRYRAMVKRCLRDGHPLLLLPMSMEGNAVGTAAFVSGLFNVHENGRCEIEITGLARCQVKTMWMKGESFGLHEAVVEYFEDDEHAEFVKNETGTDETHPRGVRAVDNAAGGTGGDEKEGSDVQDAQGNDGASEGEKSEEQGDGERGGGQAEKDASNLETLKIVVSAVLHRELFRTQKTGFSPMWPSLRKEDVSEISGYDDAGTDGGGGAGASGGLNLSSLDPEAFSFWAAQHISADADTKLRWLSCRSTEDRLVDITNHVRLTDQQANGHTMQGVPDILTKILREFDARRRGNDDDPSSDQS